MKEGERERQRVSNGLTVKEHNDFFLLLFILLKRGVFGKVSMFGIPPLYIKFILPFIKFLPKKIRRQLSVRSHINNNIIVKSITN